MKRYILILFTYFIANVVVAQTVTSSCDLNDTVGYRYKDDADRLAIRHSYHVFSTWKDSTWIDQQLSNRYLQALIAVYNATSIPASDTVCRWLNLHTNVNRPQLREFFITADSNLVWLKNLRYNVVPCGNPFIEAAIAKYGLVKKSFGALSILPYHTITWKSAYNFNGNPLASYIGANVSGIWMIGGDNGFSDGIDIADTINANYVELLYCFRWGDCIDGCDNAHYWRFRVFNDCSVAFIESFGDPMPVWASIRQQSKELADVKVYPIPANNRLTIEALNNKVKSLSIYNALGQEIKALQIIEPKTEIDISGLQPGVYFIRLNTIAGQQTGKFVKD